MNQQPLNLRRSIKIVRRYKVLVGIVIVLGALGGIGYAMATPPMLTTQALVVIPAPKPNIATQQTIAGSTPVLSAALAKLGSPMPLQTFLTKISVRTETPNVLSISANDKSAGLAEEEANDVAAAYISYIGGPNSPVGTITARVFVPATSATGESASLQLGLYGGGGALLGALIGFVVAVRRSRSDRRLRLRDEIAEAVGVPVIASIPVDAPVDAAGWGKLFDSYEPGPVNSWRLRAILDRLQVANPAAEGPAGGSAIMVLSVSADRKAVAIGPQLAAFAASIGIKTALVVGPQLGEDSAGDLRAAGVARRASGTLRPDQLLVVTPNDADTDWRQRRAALTVVATVVDTGAPFVPAALRAAPLVLGVSAGAVTREQLARTAAAVTEAGGRIAGIIVADPDPDDSTSGRAHNVARTGQRGPMTRVNDAAMEIRR
jgi:capsular polysaccharide biosynthesis protein